MKWKGIKKQYSVLLSSYLLSLGSLSLIELILGLQLSVVLLIAATTVVHIFLFLVDRYKTQPLIYICIAIAMLIFYGAYRQFEWQFMHQIGDAFNWLKSYDGTEENYRRTFAIINGMVILFGLSLISYIGNQFFMVKKVFAIGMLLLLISLCILGFQGSKIGIACWITYNFMILAEFMHQKQYGKWQSETSEMMVTLVPICLLIGIVATVLPSKETPLSWKWIFDLYHCAQEFCQDVAAEVAFEFGSVSDEFGLTFDGVEDENALGGNIGTGNQVMMTVSTGVKAHHSVYLAGIYKDTYTGENWKSDYHEKTNDIPEYKLSAYELLYGLSKGPIEAEGEMLLKQNILTVTYEKIRTRTLFLPVGTENLQDLEQKEKINLTTSSITFPKRRREKQYYKMDFLELNQSNPHFKELLDTLENTHYSAEMAIVPEAFKAHFEDKVRASVIKEMLGEKQLLEKLGARQEKIYKVYTQLPENLPERVKTLTEELTKSYDSRYDKLKAIESYLKSYEYTKTPGDAPKDQDFVDYFLFDKKEGYCTYFATSMAVMARTIGIPTRYVEGFLANEQDNGNRGEFIVRADKAHAWVEAYFDGIGWVNFEPSAGYEIQNYSSWKSIKSNEMEEVAAVTMPSIPEEPPQVEAIDNELETLAEMKKVQKYREILMSLVMAGTAILVGIIIFQILRYQIKYKKAELDQKYRIQFKEIIYLLGKMNFRLQENETLLQFQERALKQSEKEGEMIKHIVSAYSKARYSAYQISQEQNQEMQRLNQELWYFAKEEFGKVKSAWWKITYKIWGYKEF